MKVRELIEKLSEVDGELDVIFSCSIESGRTSDYCGRGNGSVEVVEDYSYSDDEYVEDEDEVKGEVEEEDGCKTVKLGKVLNIDVSGWCTSYQ